MQQNSDRSTWLWKQLLVMSFALTIFSLAYDGWHYGSPINSVMFLNLNVPDVWANFFDHFFIFFVLIMTTAFLVFSEWIFLVIPFLWLTAHPIASIILHGSFAYQFSMFAFAARWMLPLALVLLAVQKPKGALAILKISIALTFASHGIEALAEHPIFMDYILDFAETWFGIELTISQTKTILFAMGWIDMIVAVLIVWTPSRTALLYMTAWGLVTAVARVVYHGDNGITGMLLRTSHWTVPLALYLAYHNPKFKINYFYNQVKQRV